MQELVADKNQLSPHAYLLNNPHVVRTRDKQFLTEEEKTEKKIWYRCCDDTLDYLII